MSPYTLVALVVLALFATGAYFYGTKKNRWISARLTKELETLLKPRSTNYVNIGGNIGYNFVYAMPEPFTNAKGTITLSPRHSVLYLPFSLLIGVRDRYFVNLFTKQKIRGEAHLVAADHLKKANITGQGSMERRDAERKGKRFVLLWKDADLSSELDKVLEALPDTAGFKHFCAYPETKTFFLHGNPRGASLEGNLDAVLKRVSLFTGKEKT